MKGKKHTPEQIIGKLREADGELNGGATIGQVCQKLSISEPTFHRWREQYGGMKSDAAGCRARAAHREARACSRSPTTFYCGLFSSIFKKFRIRCSIGAAAPFTTMISNPSSHRPRIS